MELGSDRAEREKRLQAEIAEEFPGLYVERVMGVGWQAVPRGVVVLQSTSLERLQAKLRKQREQAEADGA